MTDTPTVTDTTERLSRQDILGYAMGDVANNVSFMMTSLFLMVYMTDIAGVPAGIAGAIYGVTKVWAGLTDLVAGNVVGRKQTKWGRLRPWLLWGSPLLSISLVLLFSTRAGLSLTATVAWTCCSTRRSSCSPPSSTSPTARWPRQPRRRTPDPMPLVLRGLPEPVGGLGLSATHLFHYPEERAHVVLNFHSTRAMSASFQRLLGEDSDPRDDSQPAAPESSDKPLPGPAAPSPERLSGAS